MQLPNREQAIVPKEKITDYLLSPTHPIGRAKAEFFLRHGFSTDSWETLGDALRRHSREHEVNKVEETPFGTRYVIEGKIPTPDGRDPGVRSVWFIEHPGESPRLVTAYPLHGSET